MKFYLNNEELNVLVTPNYNETLDETLDSGTLILAISDEEKAFDPMSVLKIEFDDNTSTSFLVMSDQVEVISRNPNLYRHTLTFIQNTRKFSKIQVRNSVFSQPAESNLKAFRTVRYGNNIIEDTYHRTVIIDAKRKIKSAKLYMECRYIEEKTNPNTGVALGTFKFSDATGITVSLFLKKNSTNYSYSLTDNQVVDVTDLISSGEYDIVVNSITGASTSVDNPIKILCVNISLEVETYYYTLYDVLDILKEQVRLNDDVYSHVAPYSLPQSGDFYNLLNEIIAPNFTFTQCNLYDCLSQIFLFLDGVPMLTEDDELGIEYFNENNSSLSYNDAETSDFQSSISEDRYVNGLITDYQRGKAEHDIVYPSLNSFNSTKSNSYGIVDFPDTACFPVSFPIRAIKKVEIYFNKTIRFNYQYDIDDDPTLNDWYDLDIDETLDLTDYFVGQEIFDLLPKENAYLTIFNAIPYSQGNTKIDVGLITTNSFGVGSYNILMAVSQYLRRKWGVYDNYPVNTMSDVIKYRITYEPMVDGRVKVESNQEKYEGTIRLDQTNGNVDLTRMGINMFGSSLKLGNEEITKTHKFTTWNNRIKKGTVWTDGNDRYIAETINTTFYKDYIIQKIKFTKNYNKLSNYINLNENKRFNNIDSSIVQKSEDNYNEYIYFSNYNPEENGQIIHLRASQVFEGIKGSIVWSGNWYSSINFACVDESLYIPLFKYGAGNSLNFEMMYDDPISAGSKFNVEDMVFANKYQSSVIKYTDDYGFKDIFTISFYDMPSNNDYSASFPEVNVSELLKYGNIPNLRYYKKPNEVFALNYALMCIPYNNQDFFFGDNFIKNNAILGFKNEYSAYLYASTSELYSVLDKKALGTNLGVISGITTSSYDNWKCTYTITGVTAPSNTKSWCLADSEGNILLATNQSLNVGDNFVFYALTRHYRMETSNPQLFNITFTSDKLEWDSATTIYRGATLVGRIKVKQEYQGEYAVPNDFTNGSITNVSSYTYEKQGNNLALLTINAPYGDVAINLQAIAPTFNILYSYRTYSSQNLSDGTLPQGTTIQTTSTNATTIMNLAKAKVETLIPSEYSNFDATNSYVDLVHSIAYVYYYEYESIAVTYNGITDDTVPQSVYGNTIKHIPIGGLYYDYLPSVANTYRYQYMCSNLQNPSGSVVNNDTVLNNNLTTIYVVYENLATEYTLTFDTTNCNWYLSDTPSIPISPNYITVPKYSVVSISSNHLTVNNTTYYCFGNAGYTVTSISCNSPITSDTTATATTTLNNYTITYNIGNHVYMDTSVTSANVTTILQKQLTIDTNWDVLVSGINITGNCNWQLDPGHYLVVSNIHSNITININAVFTGSTYTLSFVNPTYGYFDSVVSVSDVAFIYSSGTTLYYEKGDGSTGSRTFTTSDAYYDFDNFTYNGNNMYVGGYYQLSANTTIRASATYVGPAQINYTLTVYHQYGQTILDTTTYTMASGTTAVPTNYIEQITNYDYDSNSWGSSKVMDRDRTLIIFYNWVGATYSVVDNISNGDLHYSTPLTPVDTYSFYITPDTNYTYPSSIYVQNAQYTYDSSNGTMTIYSVTGQVTISGSCVYNLPTINVTYNCVDTNNNALQTTTNTLTIGSDTYGSGSPTISGYVFDKVYSLPGGTDITYYTASTTYTNVLAVYNVDITTYTVIYYCFAGITSLGSETVSGITSGTYGSNAPTEYGYAVYDVTSGANDLLGEYDTYNAALSAYNDYVSADPESDFAIKRGVRPLISIVLHNTGDPTDRQNNSVTSNATMDAYYGTPSSYNEVV